MRFEVNGKTYVLADTELSIGEARAVKKETGFLPVEWPVMLAVGDPDALAAAVWVAARRAGEEMTWEDIDKLDFLRVGASMAPDDAPADTPTGDPQPAVNGNGQAAKPRKPRTAAAKK